jgi:hypothetical protein
MTPEDQALVDAARQAAGVAADEGPDDDHVLAGISGFVQAFDFWYIRVVRGAVPKYRPLIIARINTFIRSWELEGLDAERAAGRLVEDYARRNFVTAGGWALEELAIAASTTMQKSAAEGMDAQRLDPTTNEYHLYVLKSGLVTRNSDIVKAIKANGRQAEKLLRQGRGTTSVHLNYAILAGKTSSTFEDGVARPSSAEFWSDALGLPEPRAHDLALAMAAEAGRLVTSDASAHIAALETLVQTYIVSPADPGQVDWEFLKRRTMQDKAVWKDEDKRRHQAAEEALRASGYVASPEPQDEEVTAIAEAIGEELEQFPYHLDDAAEQLDLGGRREP